MLEFVTAAQEHLDEFDEDNAITFKHDDREVTFFQPSTGQLAIMTSLTSSEMDVNTTGQFIQLFFGMMDEDTQKYFRSRLLDRYDPFEMDGKGGIVDIFVGLTKEWSGGRPTKEPADYQPPRRATGKPSTASTRAKGSTSSRSRSRASSQ